MPTSSRGDLEHGGGGYKPLPSSVEEKEEEEEEEEAELRWAFIRKIYSIVSLQMLLTITISSAVIFLDPISQFASSPAGHVVHSIIVIVLLLVMIPLSYYRSYHPINLFLMGIFTLSISFAVGFACALIDGKVILESAVLTAVVLACLTSYTFWAVKTRKAFSFRGPCFSSAAIILTICVLIQVLFPLGKMTTLIIGGLVSFAFCVFIICDTEKLIQGYKEDEYAWAAVVLYFDIIGLFFSLMTTIYKNFPSYALACF